MDKSDSVKLELNNGEIIIHDPNVFVSSNPKIVDIRIIKSDNQERKYKIIRTKNGGYLFQ